MQFLIFRHKIKRRFESEEKNKLCGLATFTLFIFHVISCLFDINTGENMLLKWVFDGGLWSVPAAGGHGHVPVNGAVWGVSSWWRRSSAGRIVTPAVWQGEFLQHSKTGWMSFQKAETNCELRNLLWQCECLCHDARFCRQRHGRCGARTQRKPFIDDNCCFCHAKYEHISILVFENHKGKPYGADNLCNKSRGGIYWQVREAWLVVATFDSKLGAFQVCDKSTQRHCLMCALWFRITFLLNESRPTFLCCWPIISTISRTA